MDRPKTPLRVNALMMAMIAAALVVFVVIVVADPSTSLIIALVAPVIVGCVAVMDKLCSPEPPSPREPTFNDEYARAVIQLFRDSLAALSNHPSAASDIHRGQGDL